MTNPFALPDTQPATPAPASNPFAAPATTSPAASTAPAYGGADPFDAPAPQEPRGPRMRDLYGRLLLLRPLKVEYGIPSQIEPGKFQDRMTADVIVLDGGPISYGGKPEGTPPVPHDRTAQVPHVTKRQFISNTGLISQCREALAKHQRGEPGMVLGRLGVGQAPATGGNPPYLLTPATDADKVLARQYLATVDPFA